MKKTILIALLSLSICQITNAQKGINLAIQYNTQTIKYNGATNTKDIGNGIGIGINLLRKVGPVQLAVDPRLMLLSHRTVSKLKTQYIQVPVSINIPWNAKNFFGNGNSAGQSFQFGLKLGLYAAYAIGGKYNGSTKMKYGESATDNRSAIDFGLHTCVTFGGTASSFKGFIEVQRGIKNVIPNARINNDTRKLNGINVGASFRIFKGK
jgi:hypothetical protein